MVEKDKVLNKKVQKKVLNAQFNEDFQKLIAKYTDLDLKLPTTASPILKGGMAEIDLARLDTRTIEKYLLSHPVIPRGIEIRANRIISRGNTITGKNQDYIDYCEGMFFNSGGLINIKKWIEDAYGFGNGWRLLVPNKAETEILKVIPAHPIYFGFLKEKKYEDGKDIWRVVIDEATQEPKACSQYRYVRNDLKMEGDPIPTNEVAHLAFDTWGDEVEGISLVQYLGLLTKYLLNIEMAGAESMYRFGFMKYKFTTDIRSPEELKKFAKGVANIREKDAVILGSGQDCLSLTPGQSDFPNFHERFLMLFAIRLGIPMPLLTMIGREVNKATLDEQKKDFHDDIYADEMIICQTIKQQWFIPACKLRFGDSFKLEDVPDFKFNEWKEDEDKKVVRMLNKASAYHMFAQTAKILSDMQKEKEVEKILNEMFPPKETEETRKEGFT